ncbi:hypothetical protein BHE74_00014343 [Ensete ventricosum]|nr:hypothetical protein GW17_00003426 [Ensete ventricosum]RWW77496.1 hypothetical protein BHE74_00014343 [Ensete ventricosum]
MDSELIAVRFGSLSGLIGSSWFGFYGIPSPIEEGPFSHHLVTCIPRELKFYCCTVRTPRAALFGWKPICSRERERSGGGGCPAMKKMTSMREWWWGNCLRAISHEEDDFNRTNAIPMIGSKTEKRPGLDVKKKPLKRVAKHRSNKKGGKKPPPRKHKKGRSK